MRIGSSVSFGLIGLKARPIRIEAFISSGLPAFSIIGLPDASLLEARERVKAAIAATGLKWPQTRITVNLSPASMPKRGSGHDLAIAMAILDAAGAIPHPPTKKPAKKTDPASSAAATQPDMNDTLILGELNLDGHVLPITGILPTLLSARQHGITTVVVPRSNRAEAELVPGLAVMAVSSLAECLRLFNGKVPSSNPVRARCRPRLSEKPSCPTDTYASSKSTSAPRSVDLAACRSGGTHQSAAPDMSDVIGQEDAKRALEIAAAGGHHILLCGPPGAGKTMLASRLPTIMPSLTEDEALEVASIRSLCGTLNRYGITHMPPFEAPHHTASAAALAGGGSGIAQPGAITKAHAGVLFLDEAPEFSSRALQVLREPMETGSITLSRAHAVTTYPARFLLVLSANPCPCGKGWGAGRGCTCTPLQRRRYWGRLTGPLLDRIDIQITVPPTEMSFTAPRTTPTSTEIRERVSAARHAAQERFRNLGWHCNAQADGAWLREHTRKSALKPVLDAVNDQRLSLRGADRTLRLAWTISDLAGATSPTIADVTEAISTRTQEQK